MIKEGGERVGALPPREVKETARERFVGGKVSRLAAMRGGEGSI